MTGRIIWLYGLSGSGKTTLGRLLENYYEKEDKRIQRLDGDISREFLTRDLGFNKKDRFENIRRNAWVAKILSDHDVDVIACFMTPTKAMRIFLKKFLGNRLTLIYCNTRLEECIERDVKGLYRKAIHRTIENFVGIDLPFEEPNTNLDDNFELDTGDTYSVSFSFKMLLKIMRFT